MIGRWVVVALCCAALGACLQTGTLLAGKQFDYGLAKREKIQKGVTTKADIETLFGEPYQAARSGNGEIWRYYSREAGHDGAYADRTLVVDFDDHAVVTNFRYQWKETKSASNATAGHPSRTVPNAAGCAAPPPPGNALSPGPANPPVPGSC